jgi:hypothetical protein
MTVLAAIDNEPGSEAVVSTGAELVDALDEELVVSRVVSEARTPAPSTSSSGRASGPPSGRHCWGASRSG